MNDCWRMVAVICIFTAIAVSSSSSSPVSDPLWGYFSSVAGQDGQIDVEELQQCLTASGIQDSYKPFSKATCQAMIVLLDRDYSGKMGFTEFKELWDALNSWKTFFMSRDTDRSGTLEQHELHAAVSAQGYNLSPTALHMMIRRFSVNGKMLFDDFILCFVRLRMLTDQFRRRDTLQNGQATFAYDGFIQVAI